MINKEEVFASLDNSKKNNQFIIVDESFMDFVVVRSDPLQI